VISWERVPLLSERKIREHMSDAGDVGIILSTFGNGDVLNVDLVGRKS